MLNSSSNTPGSGNFNGLKANPGTPAQTDSTEPIIQEVYEPEPDDYNYVPQLRTVDEQELRNLAAIPPNTGVDRRVYMASAAFLIAALIGAGIGFAIASNAASNADVQRKSALARTIKTTVEPKFKAIEDLEKRIDEYASGAYNDSRFSTFPTQVRQINFMLDIASDVTAESVLLVGDSRANPMKGLRTYSAKTMLIRQLLETHIAETRADSESILSIQSNAEAEAHITYAMSVIPDALYNMAKSAPRETYANGVIDIYTYKDVIKDDNEASQFYSQLKIDGRWSERQSIMRDYKPENKKELAALEEAGLTLPNHLIYKVTDRSGNPKNLFADELILVDRALFFGASANAKDRYDYRIQQLKKLIDEAKQASATIVADLDQFIVQ